MKSKKNRIKAIIILLVVILGLGYAYINSNLNINGTATVKNATWDVHWANVQVTDGSVTGTNVVTTPTISNNTTVNFSIILPLPGTYYEFTVDAINGGTIDAMIDSMDFKLNGATMANQPDYLRFAITYSDGVELEQNHLIAANTTEKYKVRVEYRDDIELSQIPASDQTLNLSFTVTYRQANEDAIAVDHSFNGHSWATIISNVKSGNTNNYNVGDTKTVDMGTLGTHTLRIANKSTPAECSTTGFSQTACGFVLEFADIITEHNMNSISTNVGGWPASEMRTYVNSDIYNALPSEIKNGIINTTVVSGYGENDSANFTSTDKLYLLSTHEVFEAVGGNIEGIDFGDTAYNNTRQLDYYSSQNVTTSNVSGAIKQYNGSNDWWWLRSAVSFATYYFYHVFNYCYWDNGDADITYGVSPAFRIG